MSFKFGKRSLSRMRGAHPDLVRVFNRAIEITLVDFAVTDGLRTEAQQKAMFDSGASTTMNSKHRLQADGFFHALDVAPWLAGAPRYEWPLVFAVAVAVDQAATELGVKLRWGAVWDRNLMQYGGSPEAMKAEVEAYKIRHPGKDFLDGPHFEIVL